MEDDNEQTNKNKPNTIIPYNSIIYIRKGHILCSVLYYLVKTAFLIILERQRTYFGYSPLKFDRTEQKLRRRNATFFLYNNTFTT